jgi:hypothetical protein
MHKVFIFSGCNVLKICIVITVINLILNLLFMKTLCQFKLPAIILLLSLLYSCKKLAQQQPVTPANNNVPANITGVNALLTKAYAMLDGYTDTPDSTFGLWVSASTDWLYGGVGADDAFKGSITNDQAEMEPIEQHTVDGTSGYMESKWVAIYNGVAQTNAVLNELPLVKDGSVSAAYATEVTAEARFLRGVYHTEAAKLWRNVPYITQTTSGAVANPGPIWADIEADFIAAMTALPKTQAQVCRCNYYAAEAFLAKAYVWDHQYAKALPLLNDLITNGATSSGIKYALGPYEDNFNLAKRNNPESVFAVELLVHGGSQNINGDPGGASNYPEGTYTACCGYDQPSYTLADAFQTDANGFPIMGVTATTVTDYTASGGTQTVAANLPDYNLTILPNDHGIASNAPFTPPGNNLDPRLDWTVGRRGIPYLDWGICGGESWTRGDQVPYNPIKNLFYNAQQTSGSDDFTGWSINQPGANNLNLIRFADVILWRAECEAETNLLAAAETDVNLIRNRMAQHPEYWVHTYVDSTNPSAGFTTTPAAHYVINAYNGQFATYGQAYAREAVHMEEQLEFGMEGHRFFDLQRWDPVFGGPEAVHYMANIENAHIQADTRIQNPVLDNSSFTAGKNELYPIPQQQIAASNGKLKQNPGY